MRVSAAQGHGVNKYGGRRSRGSGGYSRESCENESGELRERPEYLAEQRTCQLHRPSYCQWRLWRWLRVERSFSEAFMCRTFPFYTLSDREFVTEKYSTFRRMLRRSGCIIHSPTFNKVMISKGLLFLFYITQYLRCSKYYQKYGGKNGRHNNAFDSSIITAVTDIGVQVFLSRLLP